MNPQPPTAPGRTYECSICREPSQRICLYCTKDACENHLCSKCGRCSDCCECEQFREPAARPAAETAG